MSKSVHLEEGILSRSKFALAKSYQSGSTAEHTWGEEGENPEHAPTQPFLSLKRGVDSQKAKRDRWNRDSNVGKTSLLTRFADDHFSDSFISTIGVRPPSLSLSSLELSDTQSL